MSGNDEKLFAIVMRVREALMRSGMNIPGRKPRLVLVSREDVDGTEIAIGPLVLRDDPVLEGVTIDASRLVPPGGIFVDIAG